VPDPLKKFQDTKNKEYGMTHRQIKQLRGDLNKHQSETKDTVKREIHELKRITQIIKEELNKYLENLRRKNQKEILEIKIPVVKQKTHWKANPAD
jgi:Tfp pilus assembly protein PilP